MVLNATLGTLDLGVIVPGSDTRWALPPGRGLTGWGSPASTAEPSRKTRANGVWVGERFLGARSLGLAGTMTARTVDVASAALDRLIAAASLEDTVLTVREGSRTRYCTVQRHGEVIWDWVTPVHAEWSVDLLAADPRKFGVAVSASTGLPSSTGGLTVPFTGPFSINATTVTGQVSLTNPGNITGPVMLRIDGPVTGPVITHVGTSAVLTFSSSLVLGAGEFLIVDMEEHQTLAQGQSSRDGYVTSRGWSGFEPGSNTWSFSALSGSGLLTVTATPAWA